MLVELLTVLRVLKVDFKIQQVRQSALVAIMDLGTKERETLVVLLYHRDRTCLPAEKLRLAKQDISVKVVLFREHHVI